MKYDEFEVDLCSTIKQTDELCLYPIAEQTQIEREEKKKRKSLQPFLKNRKEVKESNQKIEAEQ